MRVFLVLGVTAVAAAGCGHEALQVSTARDVRTEMLQMQLTPAERQELPPAVVDFRAEVRQLADNQDPKHAATVRAMRLMAGAVRTLPAADQHAAFAIDEQAALIQKSSASAVHSDATKRALGNAVDALDAARQQKDVAGWQARIDGARKSVDAIDAETPYLQQRGAIDKAFIDVADAFVLGSAPSVSAAQEAMGETMKSAKVERWLFDQRGHSPDLEGMCGGPAKSVILDRTPGDATAAFFTFGFYTPVHVRVNCLKHGTNTAKR